MTYDELRNEQQPTAIGRPTSDVDIPPRIARIPFLSSKFLQCLRKIFQILLHQLRLESDPDGEELWYAAEWEWYRVIIEVKWQSWYGKLAKKEV